MPRPSTDKMTDREILDRFYKDRNNEWLGILLNRYTLLLLGLCMKYLRNEEDARDMVQQVFIKVLHEAGKYEITYFKTWLYMVAKNECLMELRRKKQPTVEIIDKLHGEQDDPDELEAFWKKEQSLQDLESAIGTLNEEQKHCITLFYLEKKTYLEITEMTGYTPMQVKSHIQNGKRNLKNWLEKKSNG